MNIEERINKIEERNKRVELDKKWETCWTRKISIMILTYIVVIIYSYVIRKYDNIFLSVPPQYFCRVRLSFLVY